MQRFSQSRRRSSELWHFYLKMVYCFIELLSLDSRAAKLFNSSPTAWNIVNQTSYSIIVWSIQVNTTLNFLGSAIARSSSSTKSTLLITISIPNLIRLKASLNSSLPWDGTRCPAPSSPVHWLEWTDHRRCKLRCFQTICEEKNKEEDERKCYYGTTCNCGNCDIGTVVCWVVWLNGPSSLFHF